MPKGSYSFLKNAGEVGKLILEYDWSRSPLGHLDNWPQSLVTALSIVLNSKFPMFLLWGPGHICFYNDAYRPNLTNGDALNQPAAVICPEIWAVINPIIKKVIEGGEASWDEDKLIPLRRNGRMEHVYWTFSYSPVFDESCKPGGVFITCTETTQKVKNLRQLEESKDQLEFAIEATELATWDLDPIKNTFTANARYTEWFGIPASDETDNILALKVIADEDRERVIAAYTQALDYFSGSHYDIEYTIHPDDKPKRIVRAKGKAWFGEDKIAYRFNGTLQDITSEAKIKRELAENKHTLEMAIEISELGVFSVDLHTRKATYSSQVMHWFGINQPFLPLKKIYGSIHPDDLPMINETIKYTVENESDRKHDLTYRVINAEKETKYLRSIGEVQLEKGIPQSISGILQDVTEQVISTARLKESEARFRTLIEEAPVATCLFVGPDMIVEIANDAMLQFWGKRKKVLGQPLAAVLPELEGQPFREILNEVYSSGIAYEAKAAPAVLMVNGALRNYYFDFTYKPIANSNGEVYGIVNMAIDVTDEVFAKRGLEENERNLRNLILQAPVAICILKGAKHVIEIANEKMLEFWNKADYDVIMKPVFDALPEARHQGFEEQLALVYNTGKTHEAQGVPVNLLRKNGMETRFMNVMFQAYRDAQGTIVGVLIVVIDVTEQVVARQQIEEVVSQRTAELASANKALKQNNQELEQFAYIASHDLQEPLRKVSTFAGMLKGHLGTVDEKTAFYIDKIMLSADRMMRLIHDLLNFSKLEYDKEEFVDIDLNEVLEEIKSDFELYIEQKSATIHYKSLPVIEAIPLQMLQLFRNLVSNALKFSRPSVPPVITIHCELLPHALRQEHHDILQGEDYFLITVRDNGIGFNQEYSEKIFSIFQRLHTKTQYDGTGIGLALCKKIVHNHHGKVWATSDGGEGACFYIILPSKQLEIEKVN